MAQNNLLYCLIYEHVAFSFDIEILLPAQFPGNRFQVHEIAETRPSALSHLILAAAGFTEVCDWAQFRINRTASKPAVVQVVDGSLGVFFSPEL